MNWKDIASAGKSIGKLDSLDVSENTKVTMEAVMCAMAASGKVQEMGLIAQTLEKVDTQVDLKTVSSNLSELVNTMQAKEQQPVETVSESGMSDIGHALTSIASRLDVLEGKQYVLVVLGVFIYPFYYMCMCVCLYDEHAHKLIGI